MTIDRLSGIDPVKPVQPVQKTHKQEASGQTDSVHVSKQGRTLADAHIALEAVRNAPDIREDKVAEVARKLKDPSYINDALLNIVADKILDSYGL